MEENGKSNESPLGELIPQSEPIAHPLMAISCPACDESFVHNCKQLDEIIHREILQLFKRVASISKFSWQGAITNLLVLRKRCLLNLPPAALELISACHANLLN